jgi:acylphosphatase
MDKKNLRVTISGKVHGVYFRKSVKMVADIIDVKGYVQNETDGTVTVVVEGDDEMVNKLIDYCHHGPEGAVVEKVSITLGTVQGYSSFEIRE